MNALKNAIGLETAPPLLGEAVATKFSRFVLPRSSQDSSLPPPSRVCGSFVPPGLRQVSSSPRLQNGRSIPPPLSLALFG